MRVLQNCERISFSFSRFPLRIQLPWRLCANNLSPGPQFIDKNKLRSPSTHNTFTNIADIKKLTTFHFIWTCNYTIFGNIHRTWLNCFITDKYNEVVTMSRIFPLIQLHRNFCALGNPITWKTFSEKSKWVNNIAMDHFYVEASRYSWRTFSSALRAMMNCTPSLHCI